MKHSQKCNPDTRDTQKPERDKALMESYDRVIKELGPMASRVTKKSLYEEAAKDFYISPKTAGQIIRKLLKTCKN